MVITLGGAGHEEDGMDWGMEGDQNVSAAGRLWVTLDSSPKRHQEAATATVQVVEPGWVEI